MGAASPADGFAGGGGSDTVHGTGPLVPSVEWVVLAVGLGEIAAKGKYWNPCLYLLPLYLFPISPHWKWEYLTWSSIKFTPVILHVNLNCVRDKYLMSKVLLLGRTIFMKSGTNIFCLISSNHMYCALKLCVQKHHEIHDLVIILKIRLYSTWRRDFYFVTYMQWTLTRYNTCFRPSHIAGPRVWTYSRRLTDIYSSRYRTVHSTLKTRYTYILSYWNNKDNTIQRS